MRIKAFSPLLEGYECKATLSTMHSTSSYGQPVLVLDDGTPMGVADVLLADYRIVEATKKERLSLQLAGYNLPEA